MSKSPRIHRPRAGNFARLLLIPFLVVQLAMLLMPGEVRAQEGELNTTDLPGPSTNQRFAPMLHVLPNGNFIVIDHLYDLGATANVGAVTLYDGATLAVISRLTGATAEDQVGSYGVTILPSGNFLVYSPAWDAAPGAADTGAVTWVSATAGVNDVISASNSLVGSTAEDQAGASKVVVLTDGDYVVITGWWHANGVQGAGAVTWGSGSAGVSGPISAANSLVGSADAEMVGVEAVAALANGNYVVVTSGWNAPGVALVGAVTWGDGDGGTVGPVSAANSLIGATAHDMVGSGGVTALTNGDYVVHSSHWDAPGAVDAGAVTWCRGDGPTVGVVSTANSLYGSSAADMVGNSLVAPLPDGDYVLRSMNWDAPGAVDAGAVTWATGDGSTVGVLSAANSLVGSTAGDRAGSVELTVLTDGDYVVSTPDWDMPGATNAGAVTWGNGSGGTVGEISAANSLVGNREGGGGSEVLALSNNHYVVVGRGGEITWGNGNGGTVGIVSSVNSLVGTGAGSVSGRVHLLADGDYVVISYRWSAPGADEAGAVTWGDGNGGTVGTISAANSLVGSHANDQVGGNFSTDIQHVIELADGDYVVVSPFWAGVGAVTWCNGDGSTVGAVTEANSLVGSTAEDRVGERGVTALSNGAYVVGSPLWDAPGVVNAGAATWGKGDGSTVGPITASNSLIGSTQGDSVGGDVTVLSDGNYVVSSSGWHAPLVARAGAVTWGDGGGGTVGEISAANSLVGSAVDDGVGWVTALPDGEYVVSTDLWRGDAPSFVGAITWARAGGGTVGRVTTANSIIGTTPAWYPPMEWTFGWAFNKLHGQLLVGRPREQILTVVTREWSAFTPIVWR